MKYTGRHFENCRHKSLYLLSYEAINLTLLDPAIHRWIYTYHCASGVCYLLRPSVLQTLGLFPITMRPVSVIYFFIYLLTCLRSQ